VFAPDGPGLIYLDAKQATRPVILRDEQGTSQRVLFHMFNSQLWDASFHFGTLLFSTPSGSGGQQIVEVYPDSVVRVRYSVPVGMDDLYASVSPDGGHMAFVRRAKAGSHSMRVLLRSTDSGVSDTSLVVFQFTANPVSMAIHWTDDQNIIVTTWNGSPTESVKWQVVPSVKRLPALPNTIGIGATPDPGSGRIASILAGEVLLTAEDGTGNTT